MRICLLAFLFLLPALPVSAQSAEPVLANDCYRYGQLLDPDAPLAQREDQLRRLRNAADSDRRGAQHMLGTLYRLGHDHPARLVARDDAQARHWLGRAALDGELPAMAGLAEMDLEAGKPMDAMVWAQVLTAYGHKHAVPFVGTYREYQADLILRAYQALGRARSKALSEEIQEYVNGFVASYGARLDAAFSEREAAKSQPLDNSPTCPALYDFGRWPVHLQPRSSDRPMANTRESRKLGRAGYALFYVDIQPDGSVSRALIIDALPGAEYGAGLLGTVQRMRFNAIEDAPVRTTLLPISMNTGAVKIKN